MSKKTFNKPKRVQAIYFLLIVFSGGMLFYLNKISDEEPNIWILLFFLFILMYSLLKSTKNWSYDNPKNNEENEEEKNNNKLVYKDKNIPTLEEMIKKNQKK